MAKNVVYIEINQEDEDIAIDQLQEIGEILEYFPANMPRIISKLQRDDNIEAIIITSPEDLSSVKEAVLSSEILSPNYRKSAKRRDTE